MKTGLNRVCLLSLLITLLSLSTVYSSDGKWDIKIALSKHDYVYHEPILLDVTLTNKTPDTLRTHGLIQPNHREFYILLTDSEGKQMKYTGLTFALASGPGDLLLDAGEQDYGAFNLLDLFGLRDADSGYKVSWMWFPFIPEGVYKVVVEFEGSLSNELTFNVVEPYGQEAEVLKKIEYASHIWSKDDTAPSCRAYGEIVHDYPNSVFAEQCYYLSRFFSPEIFGEPGSGSYDKSTLIREMLSQYPNSPEVRGWLWFLTLGKSDYETTAFLSELTDKHPDTRCSKVASLLKKRMLAKRDAGE